MDYMAIFVIAAILEILSATMIFVFKDVLHSVLALSFFFIFNSALFFILEQPLLALLQLFLMVGGVSTFMFVGVGSTSYSKFRHTNFMAFVIIYLMLLLSFSYGIAQLRPQTLQSQQNPLSDYVIYQSFSTNLGMFYLIGFALFATGLSAIVIMKKLGARK